tara:strand:- start:2465 stop:2842 length:378 start_codon:yes stop_codon:yes gene_type:complete
MQQLINSFYVRIIEYFWFLLYNKIVMNKIYIIILICVFYLFDGKKAYALNSFELALIAISLGYSYDKYYDKSLTYESTYKKKLNVIEKFLDSKRVDVSSSDFINFPTQQKLLVIEEINNLKRQYP